MGVNLRKSYNEWYRIRSRRRRTKVRPQTSAFYRQILAALKSYNNRPRPKLLDIACGVGKFLQEAQNEDFSVFGIDISDIAVAQAKKIHGAHIARASAEKLPFRESTFDFVTCIGSLEHFRNPEKALKEIGRVLVPRGVCFLHVPNLMFAGHIYMTLRYGLMPSEGKQSFSETFRTYLGWKELIERYDMKIIYCNTHNALPATRKVSWLVRAIWNYLLKYFIPFHLSYAFNFYCRKKRFQRR